MRTPTTVGLLERFMVALGRAVRDPANVYFTGGVTAILHAWRSATVDIDLTTDPPVEAVTRAASRLKDTLNVNVELAAPHDFIPELPGWRERSVFIRREGSVSFFHYDPYSQALAKIERGHEQDVADVASMLRDGLVERPRLLELFAAIEPDLERYPAVDQPSFRQAVEVLCS